MTGYNGNRDKKETISYWKPSGGHTAELVFFFVIIMSMLILSLAQAGFPDRQALPVSSPESTEPAVSKKPTAGDDEQKAREQALAEWEDAIEKRELALARKEEALKQATDIRPQIICELKEKLSVLNLPLEINQTTGSVRFTEAVLFGVNSDSLNESGKMNLETFMPAYLSVLLSDENEQYLEQIIIEGHTDNNGGYWSNLFLSQNRANSVVNFLLDQNLTELPNGASAIKYLTVSARSFNLPVEVNGVYAGSQSRRVEFVFRLKNEGLVDQTQLSGEGD